MKTKKATALAAVAVLGTATGAVLTPLAFAAGSITVPGYDGTIAAKDATVEVGDLTALDLGGATLDGEKLLCNNKTTAAQAGKAETCQFLKESDNSVVATITFKIKTPFEGSDKPTTPENPAVAPKVSSMNFVFGADTVSVKDFVKQEDGTFYAEVKVKDLAAVTDRALAAETLSWSGIGTMTDGTRVTWDNAIERTYHVANDGTNIDYTVKFVKAADEVAPEPAPAPKVNSFVFTAPSGETMTVRDFEDRGDYSYAEVTVADLEAISDDVASAVSGSWIGELERTGDVNKGDDYKEYSYTLTSGEESKKFTIRFVQAEAPQPEEPAYINNINVNGHDIVFGDKHDVTVEVDGLDGITGDVLASSSKGDIAWRAKTTDLTNGILVYEYVVTNGGQQETYTVTFKLVKAPELSSEKSVSFLNINGYEVKAFENNFAKVEVDSLDGIDGTVLGSAFKGADLQPSGSVEGENHKAYYFTVTAEDGSTAQYVVDFVKKAPVASSDAWITSIDVDGYYVPAEKFENGKATIEVDSLDGLTGEIAGVAFAGKDVFLSGSVEGEGHKAFYYTVVAEDGTQADYVIDFVLKAQDDNGETDQPGTDEETDNQGATGSDTGTGSATGENSEKALPLTGGQAAGIAGVAAAFLAAGAAFVARARRRS